MIAINYVPTNYVHDRCGLLSPDIVEVDVDFNDVEAVKAEVLKLFDGAKLMIDEDCEEVWGHTYKDFDDVATADVVDPAIAFCKLCNGCYYTIVVEYKCDGGEMTEFIVVTAI
jgi:hypothetical protein